MFCFPLDGLRVLQKKSRPLIQKMKNAPFLLSSVLALVAVILSVVSFTSAQSNNSMQTAFIEKQNVFQELQQDVTLKNQEYQRQAEVINTGANLAQKVVQPILVEMGYLAAKHKNEKLLGALKDQKFQDAIPNDEKLKEMDKLIEQSKVKPGATAPAPAAAPAAPALRATDPTR